MDPSVSENDQLSLILENRRPSISMLEAPFRCQNYPQTFQVPMVATDDKADDLTADNHLLWNMDVGRRCPSLMPPAKSPNNCIAPDVRTFEPRVSEQKMSVMEPVGGDNILNCELSGSDITQFYVTEGHQDLAPVDTSSLSSIMEGIGDSWNIEDLTKIGDIENIVLQEASCGPLGYPGNNYCLGDGQRYQPLGNSTQETQWPKDVSSPRQIYFLDLEVPMVVPDYKADDLAADNHLLWNMDVGRRCPSLMPPAKSPNNCIAPEVRDIFSKFEPQNSPQRTEQKMSVTSNGLMEPAGAPMECNLKNILFNSYCTTYPNGTLQECSIGCNTTPEGLNDLDMSSLHTGMLSVVNFVVNGMEINKPGPSTTPKSTDKFKFEDKVNKTTPKKCRGSKRNSQQKNKKLLPEESDSDDSDKEYSSENKIPKTEMKATRKTGKASGRKHHVLSKEEKRRRNNESSKKSRDKHKQNLLKIQEECDGLEKTNKAYVNLRKRLKDALGKVQEALYKNK